MINIGIIGYGMSAKTFHEPFIRAHNEFTLVAINSSKPTSALPDDVKRYTKLDDMLNDPNIDVVVNTSPTGYHFTTSEKVLRAKKHIVLEKPMTTTVAEAETLLQLAKQYNVKLAVYHNRRFTGDFQTVRQCLADGLVGTVHYAEIHFDRFRPVVRDRWRENAGEGAGVLYDLGSHLLDQALQLFGVPSALTARNVALRPQSPTVDYVHIQLHYEQLEVIVNSNPYHSAPNLMYSIAGDQGTFVKYGLDPQEMQSKAGMSPLDPQFGKANPTHDGIFYDAVGAPTIIPTLTSNYLQFYDNLALAITQNVPLTITPEQALSVIKIIELAQQSSDTGKTRHFSE